jgi:outer membrane protein TolC
MRGLYHALLALAGVGALGYAPVARAQVPDTLRITLGEAARIAADRSPLVAAAQFGTQGARARRTETASVLWPRLSAYAEDGERTFNLATFGIPATFFPGMNQVIGPIRTIDLRGQLRQTLFDWSAIQRLRGASANLHASRVEEEAVRDSVAALALMAYVQALRADGELAAREADLGLAAELREVAAAQLAAGVGVRLDLTRAEAQVARTRAQVVGAAAAAEQGRLTLLHTLSLPLETPLLLTDSLSAVLGPVPPVAEAVAGALAQRSDLRELDAQIRAGQLQVAAIRAERLPYLTFKGDNGWTGTSLDELPRTYSWNFKVSIPIFNGWARKARIQEQEAAVGVLEAQREELRQEVVYGVRSALLQLRSAAAQVTAEVAALRLAEAEVAEAQARFSAGVAGSADVVNAALRLSDARTAYVDALAGYLAARVALARARGTPRELP